MFKSLIIPLLTLLFLASCSQGGKQSDTNLVVSMNALLGDLTFPGGATLMLVNSATKEVITKDLTLPYKMLIPHGTWSLYLVGFDGASDWQGPQQCGSLMDVNFYESTTTVTIYVNSNKCAPEPFFSIITKKSATTMPLAQWGSNWAEAKWGP